MKWREFTTGFSKKPPEEQGILDSITDTAKDAYEWARDNTAAQTRLLLGMGTEAFGKALNFLGDEDTLAAKYNPSVASTLRSAGDSANNLARGLLTSAADIAPVADYDSPVGAFANQVTGAVHGGIGRMASMLHLDQTADAGYNAAQKTANTAPVSTDDLVEYFTNPRGFISDTGQLVGSMATIVPFMGLLPEAIAARGLAALGGDALVQGLVNRGMYGLAKFFASSMPRAVQYGLTSAPIEGAMEGGETRRELLNRGASEKEATRESLIAMGKNVPLLVASNTLEGLSFFSPLRAGNKALQIGGRGLLNSLQQQYEEFAQQGIQNEALGEPYGWLPWNGAPNQYEAAERVRYPSLLMGGAGGAIQAYAGDDRQDNWERGSQEKNSIGDYSTRANKSANSLALDNFMQAIGQQESDGNYDLTNPDSGAAGKFQIMPDNWSSWAQDAGLSPDAPMTPENQNLVARNKMQEYFNKFGNWRDVAIAWYGGEGAVDWSEEAKNRPQGEYPSVNEYADSVMARFVSLDNKKSKGQANGIDFATGLQSAKKALDGKQMDNGTVGCVEAVTKILSHVHPEFKKMVEDGVVNTVEGDNSLHSRLEKMGIEIIPFDESKVAQGDIIFYDDKQTYQHVLVADHKDENGQWRVFGNSSSNNRVMEQPLYQGQTPSWIAKVSNLQSSQHSQGQTQQGQPQQKETPEPEPTKPLFDLNAEDSTTQNLLEKFLNERFNKAVEDNDVQEMGFIQNLVDDKFSLINTPENRKAILDHYGDELNSFVQANAPAQPQSQTQPRAQQSQQQQQNQPLSGFALKSAVDALKEKATAEHNLSLLLRLNRAENNPEELRNILAQNGVAISSPTPSQITPSSQVQTTSQATAQTQMQSQPQPQQDPVKENRPPENVLTQPQSQPQSQTQPQTQPKKEMRPREELIKIAGAPIQLGHEGTEARKEQGEALIELAEQDGKMIPKPEIIALQNGSTMAVQKWRNNLLQNPDEAENQQKKADFDAAVKKNSQTDHGALADKAKQAKDRYDATRVDPIHQQQVAASEARENEEQKERLRREEDQAENNWASSQSLEQIRENYLQAQAKVRALENEAGRTKADDEAYERQKSESEAQEDEEYKEQLRRREDQDEDVKASQQSPEEIRENYLQAQDRAQALENGTIQEFESEQQRTENQISAIQSVMGVSPNDTQTRRQIAAALKEPSKFLEARKKQGRALLNLLNRPQMRYSADSTGELDGGFKRALENGYEKAITKAQEMLRTGAENQMRRQQEKDDVSDNAMLRSELLDDKLDRSEALDELFNDEESYQANLRLEDDTRNDERTARSELLDTKLNRSEDLEELFDDTNRRPERRLGKDEDELQFEDEMLESQIDRQEGFEFLLDQQDQERERAEQQERERVERERQEREREQAKQREQQISEKILGLIPTDRFISDEEILNQVDEVEPHELPEIMLKLETKGYIEEGDWGYKRTAKAQETSQPAVQEQLQPQVQPQEQPPTKPDWQLRVEQEATRVERIKKDPDIVRAYELLREWDTPRHRTKEGNDEKFNAANDLVWRAMNGEITGAQAYDEMEKILYGKPAKSQEQSPNQPQSQEQPQETAPTSQQISPEEETANEPSKPPNTKTYYPDDYDTARVFSGKSSAPLPPKPPYNGTSIADAITDIVQAPVGTKITADSSFYTEPVHYSITERGGRKMIGAVDSRFRPVVLNRANVEKFIGNAHVLEVTYPEGYEPSAPQKKTTKKSKPSNREALHAKLKTDTRPNLKRWVDDAVEKASKPENELTRDFLKSILERDLNDQELDNAEEKLKRELDRREKVKNRILNNKLMSEKQKQKALVTYLGTGAPTLSFLHPSEKYYDLQKKISQMSNEYLQVEAEKWLSHFDMGEYYEQESVTAIEDLIRRDEAARQQAQTESPKETTAKAEPEQTPQAEAPKQQAQPHPKKEKAPKRSKRVAALHAKFKTDTHPFIRKYIDDLLTLAAEKEASDERTSAIDELKRLENATYSDEQLDAINARLEKQTPLLESVERRRQEQTRKQESLKRVRERGKFINEDETDFEKIDAAFKNKMNEVVPFSQYPEMEAIVAKELAWVHAPVTGHNPEPIIHKLAETIAYWRYRAKRGELGEAIRADADRILDDARSYNKNRGVGARYYKYTEDVEWTKDADRKLSEVRAMFTANMSDEEIYRRTHEILYGKQAEQKSSPESKQAPKQEEKPETLKTEAVKPKETAAKKPAKKKKPEVQITSDENRISSSGRARDSSEIFTTPEGVQRMLDLTEEEYPDAFTNPEYTVLDPTAGEGAFTTAVLQRKLDNQAQLTEGTSLQQFQRNMLKALSTVYSIELHADNVAELKKNMQKVFTDHYRAQTGEELKKNSLLFRRMQDIIDANHIQGNTREITKGDEAQTQENLDKLFRDWTDEDLSLNDVIVKPEVESPTETATKSEPASKAPEKETATNKSSVDPSEFFTVEHIPEKKNSTGKMKPSHYEVSVNEAKFPLGILSAGAAYRLTRLANHYSKQINGDYATSYEFSNPMSIDDFINDVRKSGILAGEVEQQKQDKKIIDDAREEAYKILEVDKFPSAKGWLDYQVEDALRNKKSKTAEELAEKIVSAVKSFKDSPQFVHAILATRIGDWFVEQGVDRIYGASDLGKRASEKNKKGNELLKQLVREVKDGEKTLEKAYAEFDKFFRPSKKTKKKASAPDENFAEWIEAADLTPENLKVDNEFRDKLYQKFPNIKEALDVILDYANLKIQYGRKKDAPRNTARNTLIDWLKIAASRKMAKEHLSNDDILAGGASKMFELWKLKNIDVVGRKVSQKNTNLNAKATEIVSAYNGKKISAQEAYQQIGKLLYPQYFTDSNQNTTSKPDGEMKFSMKAAYDPNIDVTANIKDRETFQKVIRKIIVDNAVPDSKLTPQQKLIKSFGKKLGVPVEFFTYKKSLFFQGKKISFSGTHFGGTTFINTEAKTPLGQTFWHETMHWLKANNPKLYQQLVKAANITDEQRRAWRAGAGTAYSNSKEALDEEIICDQMENIAERTGLLQNLAGQDRSLIEHVVQWLQDVMNKFIEYFRNPQGLLKTKQAQALADEFGKIANGLRDSEGRRIFQYNRRTYNVEVFKRNPRRTLTKNLNPVYVDTEDIFADNGIDLSQKVFDKYLTKGIMKMVREAISKEISEYVDLSKMSDPVARDKARDSLPYINNLLTKFNFTAVQNRPDYKNHFAARIEYARRCFDYDKRIRAGALESLDRNQRQGRIGEARSSTVSGSDARGAGSQLQGSYGGISRSVSGGQSAAYKHFLKLYGEMAAPQTTTQNSNNKQTTERADRLRSVLFSPVGEMKFSLSLDSNNNSTESFTQKIKNKVTSFFNDDTPSERRDKRIKDGLQKITGYRILFSHTNANQAIIDDFNKVIQAKHAYEWNKLLPQIGGRIAQNLKLNSSQEMSNYIADWLLTGALNNTSAQAKDFQQAMRANPELAQLMQDVRNTFQEITDMSPLERVKSKIVHREKKPLIQRLWGERNNIIEQFFDDLHPIQKMVRQMKKSASPEVAQMIDEMIDPYKLARLVRGKGAIADLMIDTDKVNIEAVRKALQEHNPYMKFDRLKSLSMIIDEAGGKENLEDFEAYCVAKLDKEIHEKNHNDPSKKVTPMFDEATDDAVIKAGEKKFGQAQRSLVTYSNILLTMQYNAGLLSKNQYSAIIKGWKNYVPLARVFDENEDFDLTNSLERRKGSKRDAFSPIAKLICNTHEFIGQAERNKVKLELANIVRCGGLGELVAEVEKRDPDVDDIITYKENGQTKYLQVVDPAIKRAIDSMQTKSESNWLMKAVSTASRYMRNFLTLMNPDYAIGNIFRDMADAFIHNKNLDANPFIAAMEVWHASIKEVVGKQKSQDYIDWLVSGGSQSGFITEDIESAGRSIRDLTKGTRKQRYTSREAFSQLMDDIGRLAEVSEYTTRLSTYKTSKTKLASQRTNGVATLEDKRNAALMSRDASIDFAKAGRSGRLLNRFVLFSNAALQALSLWGEKVAAAKRGERGAKKALAASVFRATAMGIIPAIVQAALMHSDDDRKKKYKQAQNWEKDTYWILGDFKVPKGLDVSIKFMSALTDEFMDKMIDDDPVEFDRIGKAFVDAAPSLTATIATPAIEALTNYSFFRGGPIVPYGEHDLPAEKQFGADTSWTAKFIGDKLGASPRKIDYMIQGYLGFMGRTFSKVPNFIERGGVPLDEMPMLRRFYFNPYKNPKIVKDYYEIYDEQQTLYNGYKLDRQRGKKVPLPDGYDAKLHARLKAAQEPMRALSKQQKRIIDNPKLSTEEREAKIQELEKKRIALCEKAFKRAR